MDKITSFEIALNRTHVPPPFAHFFIISGFLKGDEFTVDFKAEYTDRDEISKEEILDEGFSLDDDFQWKGTMDNAWAKELIKFFSENEFRAKDDDEVSVILKYGNNKEEKGIYSDRDAFIYLVEELIQGIYATASKDVPLEIKYKNIKESDTIYKVITPDFRKRKLLLISIEGENEISKEISWDSLRTLMEELYSAEFDYDNGLIDEPTQKGVYFNPGEGIWYKEGEGIFSPKRSKRTLERIKEYFI